MDLAHDLFLDHDPHDVEQVVLWSVCDVQEIRGALLKMIPQALITGVHHHVQHCVEYPNPEAAELAEVFDGTGRRHYAHEVEVPTWQLLELP